MFDTVLGLPLHPLVVHATVILIPVAALLVLGVAFVPATRRWARWVTPVVAVVAAALVPVTTQSGEALEHRMGGESPLIEAHAALGDQMLPWAAAVAVMALALTWLHRHHNARPAIEGDDAATGTRPNRAVSLVVSVLAAVASIGAIVQIVRIGHSGATAVWSGVVSAAAHLP